MTLKSSQTNTSVMYFSVAKDLYSFCMSIEFLSGGNNNTWWFYNWEVFLG